MDIKRLAISGVKWNAVSTTAGQILSFLTTVVLARLLDPSDFGIMGMVTIVTSFAAIFCEMGLSNAIIQRKNVPEKHLYTFFWINFLFGGFIFCVIILISPFCAAFFDQPKLARYLVLTAAVFLLAPLSQVFGTLLRKDLKFNILAKLEIFGTVVYAIVAISCALLGFGVYSLIYGRLIATLANALILFLLFRHKWLPKFYFNLNEIKEYLGFGLYQTGGRIVTYLYSNIDYIIIGKFFNAEQLGYYTLAYNLMCIPRQKINPIINKVTFPVFSKIQDDNQKISRHYCKIMEYLSFISFPILLGLFLMAPEIIIVAYGDKWAPAIPVLQVLAIAGIFFSLGNPTGSILLAKGRADINFYWNIFVVIVVTVAVLISVQWGIVGVAFGILISITPLFFILQFIINRLIEMNYKQYFASLIFPTICSIIMLISVFIVKRYISGINIYIRLFGLTFFGALVYFSSYYFLNKNIYKELNNLIRGK